MTSVSINARPMIIDTKIRPPASGCRAIDSTDAAMARPGVRLMDFTGRPMRGFVYVSPAGYESDDALRGWVDEALSFVRSLPAKKPARKRGKR